jgi:hypothetical protein
VLPIPPGQADARALVLARGGPAIAVLLFLVLFAGIVAADHSLARWLLVPLLLWMPLRAPVGPLVGAPSLFSPATYYFGNGAPFAGSAVCSRLRPCCCCSPRSGSGIAACRVAGGASRWHGPRGRNSVPRR